MPTFSAVAYPVSAYTTYTHTFVDQTSFINESNFHNHTSPAYTLNDPLNDWAWKNYTGLSTVENNTNQCAKIYHDLSGGYTPQGGWNDTPYTTCTIWENRAYGRMNWNMKCKLTGWEDLPEYIVPKGVVLNLHLTASFAPPYTNVGIISVYLEKPNGTQAGKFMPGPNSIEDDPFPAFVTKTSGGSTDIWFTTAQGLSSQEVRGDMSCVLQVSSLRTPGMYIPSTWWTWVDQVEFVMYFQTDWYYGIVGTQKGMQNKMNGISLATVAGVNGMDREVPPPEP